MRRSLFLALLVIPSLSLAAVQRVPSQYATIQAGIDACAEGDTVLVAQGTYTGEGNWNLSFQGTNLLLASEAGAELTIIDCHGRGNRGILFTNGEGPESVFRGFSIQDGYSPSSGGGILIEDSSPTLIDVHVVSCGTSGKGGGMACYRGSPLVQDAAFQQNGAFVYYSGTLLGGGVYCEDSSAVFENVLFDGNTIAIAFSDWSYDTSCLGAGLAVVGGSAVVSHSIFQGNWANLDQGPNGGGAIYVDGEVRLNNVTIVDNSSYYGSAIKGNTAHVENSIIAFNRNDQPVLGQAYLQCTDIFGHNTHGDYVGFISDQYGVNGNFAGDPQFCDLDGTDLRLQPDSPCLPGSNDCGVPIGALGPGCDDTPVFLTAFTAAPTPGAVDLFWRLGYEEPAAVFEVRAARNGVSWVVPWQQVGAETYTARDEGSSLGIGGPVIYRLSGTLPGEEWQSLRTLTVEVPPADGSRLRNPHPNPFNPSTELGFDLVEPATVSLAIYDVAGRRVVRLLNALHRGAGRHVVTWDGRDETGQPQPSGVYFARFLAGKHCEEVRLVLLK